MYFIGWIKAKCGAIFSGASEIIFSSSLDTFKIRNCSFDTVPTLKPDDILSNASKIVKNSKLQTDV